MATQSVQRNRQGPDWPLGLIAVTTPGVPVGIMTLVDPSDVDDPNSPTSATSGEYTNNAHEIQFQAVKAGASHGLQPNTGNIYIVRRGVQGAGNRDDYGSCVTMLFPGQTYNMRAAEVNVDTLNPYQYFIDADNASDAALVTMFIG